MKKCLMLLLATTLIIVLAGCSGKELNKEQDIKDESETEKTESNGNKNKTGTDMTPIETELDGAHNGMFVVTIDGKKYRYRMAPIQNNNLIVGEMIYKWDDQENEFEFFTLKEHPDYKYLKCISNENGCKFESLIEYAPATGLPEGSLDEIISDGLVVIKNGSVISGENKWLEFVKKAEANEPAEIRIAHYYTLTGRMAKKLYELTKMDYPVAYFHQLKFDGEKYIYTPLQKLDGSDDKYVFRPDDEYDWEETYKYLKHYTESAPSDTALFNTFDKYVLVNDDTITWEDIWNGMISSEFGAGVKHAEVFNKYDYKDGVDPDEVIPVDI